MGKQVNQNWPGLSGLKVWGGGAENYVGKNMPSGGAVEVRTVI